MQKHLPTAVSKSLKQFIGFGTNQMGVVAFSMQMAYLDKDGNTCYDHQLVHPHKDWKNITRKADFINTDQKTKFLKYTNAGFKLVQNPKAKVSQTTENKVKPCDESNKENVSPAKRFARRLRVEDDEDNVIETLEDEPAALEKEANHDDGTSTEFYQAKVMQDLQDKQIKAREDDIAKTRVIAAAADTEDCKRLDDNDDGDRLSVDNSDNNKDGKLLREEEEEVVPVADDGDRQSIRGEEEDKEDKHEEDKEEAIVKKVLATRGKKGKRAPGTATQQTMVGSKGSRKTKAMTTNSVPPPTTRAPKGKADNDGGSAPHKSARLSAVDDAPRATRASAKAKEGARLGKKGTARGKGQH